MSEAPRHPADTVEASETALLLTESPATEQNAPHTASSGAVPVHLRKPGEPQAAAPVFSTQETPTMPFAAPIVEPSAPMIEPPAPVVEPVLSPEPTPELLPESFPERVAEPAAEQTTESAPEPAPLDDEVMELAPEWRTEEPSVSAQSAPAPAVPEQTGAEAEAPAVESDDTPLSSPWPPVPAESASSSNDSASDPVGDPVADRAADDIADVAPALAGGGDHLPPVAGAGHSDGDEPDNDGSDESGDEPPMTLMEHLGELRTRLLRCLIGAAVGFFLCYGIAERLFNWLAMPLAAVMPQDTRLIYTSVPEGFFVYMKVAFVAGIFVASPYIFYQVWAFVAPGLYKEERRQVLPLSIFSAVFFLMGASFCYFVVFPYAFEFFMSYSTGIIVAMPSIDEYLGFSLKMLLAFGLIFEMPLFAFFLARLGIITAAWMRKVRRYAILAVFVVAAVLTPPDVFSQMLMAVPMLLLYELSIFVAAGAGRREKPVADNAGKDSVTESDKEAA